jgi:hypothetical protein
MSCTPKAVRRNGGNCVCARSADYIDNHRFDEGTCKYGYCTVFRCRVCHGELFSWGPAGCRCDGGPKWLRHPGMAQPGYWDAALDCWVPDRVAVKPSIAKRQNR